MHPIIQKSLGGLGLNAYVRHFLFACVLFLFSASAWLTGGKIPLWGWSFMLVSTFLYPYSRFVYEGIVDYIAGDNYFLVDGVAFMAAKIASMLMCWLLAVFIAPVGLLYLYVHHSRKVG